MLKPRISVFVAVAFIAASPFILGCATKSQASIATASTMAGAKTDRFYLPQPDQPFDGKVKTRIGTLEFDNQYPSEKSMEAILDNMDFHGATQAYLWGIPMASFA